MLIDKVLNYKEEYRDEIEKMKSLDLPVILFGAGKTRDFNLQFMRSLGINPVAFCDNSVDKQGQTVDNIEILSFQQTRERYPRAYYYITTQMYYEEIRQQLIDAGCADKQISEYDIIFQLQWEENCMEYYKQNADKIEWIYSELADAQSREVLFNRLLFLRTRNRKYMLNIRNKTQYFEKDLINYKKIGCYVDLGMYTGDTISEFIDESEGCYQSIYGFEPDEEIYKTAMNNLKQERGIKFVPLATADYDGVANVENSLGVMQTIATGIFAPEESENNTFHVCKLDTYFKDISDKIDFIKMDIEGAEYATLKGASDRIASDRPALAVCVYHKQEDILEIPMLCKELVDNYQIYLRHYSDNQTETVCYFITKEEENER